VQGGETFADIGAGRGEFDHHGKAFGERDVRGVGDALAVSR